LGEKSDRSKNPSQNRNRKQRRGGRLKASKRLRSAKFRHTKAYQSYELQLQSAENEVLKLNRESISKTLSKAGIDPRKCVVVTP